jgi:tetratricopeptide (TPR) repeat protein
MRLRSGTARGILVANGGVTHPALSTITMTRFVLLLAALLSVACAFAASGGYATREEALQALASGDADQRAEALTWIANHGTAADGAILQRRLSDDNPYIRNVAEQALWLLWSHSGDDAVDALLARGVEEMRAQRFDEAIATFSEVIRLKPEFAEGWNKRATVLFLAGDFRRSLADCDEVMKRNPLHFGALAGYGQIYFQLQQYEKAIEYWQRALRVNPNMSGVELNIEAARSLIAQRRKQSA